MLSNKLKRGLSFLMAMLMVISLMPVSVLAAEEEVHDHSHEVVEQAAPETQETIVTEESVQDEAAADVPVVTPNPEIEVFQEEINAILVNYFETSELTVEEVTALCAGMDEATRSDAWFANMILVENVQFALNDGLITMDDLQILADSNPAYVAFSDYVTANAPDMSDMGLYASDTYTPIANVRVAVTESNSCKYESNTVTFTAKGWNLGIVKGTGTAKVSIYNDGNLPATISFDFTLSKVYSFTIDGAVYSASGSYSAIVPNGSSINLVLTTTTNNDTNTVKLTNFGYQAVKAASNVTFEHNTLGSITVGGTTTASGTAQEISKDGVEVKATAASGAKFVGWMDKDTHELLSRAATYQFIPTDDMTLVAVFTNASSAPWFVVDGSKLYNSMADAFSNGTIAVLASDGTLPAGTHSVPANKYLVIPYADSTKGNTAPASAPETVTEQKANATLFRTLTVPSGATINCAGHIRVDARQSSCSTPGTGRVYGAYGKIALAGTINLTGTSTLRAYGYISGGGTVNVASTSTVYELLEIADWRGGNDINTLRSSMKGDTFPIHSFYIQNIESKLVMTSGASLIAEVTIAAGLTSKAPFSKQAAIVANNDNCLFKLSSGTLTRTYSNGYVNYKIEGNSTIQSLKIGFQISALDSYEIISSEYILNIPFNMHIQFASGTSSVPVRVKLLPGAKVQIDSAATVKLTGSSELILYDYDDWNRGTYTYDAKIKPVAYSIGTKISAVPNSPGQLIVNGTFEVADKAALYSTNMENPGKGAIVTGTGTIKMTGTPDTARTTIKEINKAGETTTDTINVCRIYANLAGDGDMKNMPNGTYIGLGSNHGNKWYINKTVVAPDCVNAGSTKYYCSSANAAYSVAGAAATGKHSDTSPLDGICDVANCKAVLCTHQNTEPIAGKAATCTETGLTDGEACSTCGKVTKAQEVIPATGHVNTTTTTEDPTCTAAGSTTVTCDKCGAVISTQETPATGHTFDTTVEANAATCQAAGNKAYKQCTVCNLFFAADAEKYATGGAENADGFVIAQLEHTYTAQSDADDAMVSAANCASPAVYKAMCSVCFDKNTGKTVTVGDRMPTTMWAKRKFATRWMLPASRPVTLAIPTARAVTK